jgi:hypothetical protein
VRYDVFGRLVELADVSGMTSPVRCACGQVYDLGKVEVTARYLDCSVWKAPCCGRTADDRYESGWSIVRHYTKLDPHDGSVAWW